MRIYVTRELPGPEFEKLKREHEVVVNPSPRPPTQNELLNGVKDKDALISLLTDHITKEIIDAGVGLKSASTLKVIANCAAGYDNINVDYATKCEIMVTNTPDVLTNATAELTWALILAVARKIINADRYVREEKFESWSPKLFVGSELYGRTLGIIGAGKIGTEVGRRAKAFGMKILYTDLRENAALDGERVRVKELLRRANFVTLHVPLTSETYKLIGREEIRLMESSAFLINTSRGKVIDESALIEALAQKKIAGAGLDVYENEPEIPDELKKLDNVVLLPHIGSATRVARERMAELAVENLLIGLKGKVPPNLVNPEVLKRR